MRRRLCSKYSAELKRRCPDQLVYVTLEQDDLDEGLFRIVEKTEDFEYGGAEVIIHDLFDHLILIGGIEGELAALGANLWSSGADEFFRFAFDGGRSVTVDAILAVMRNYEEGGEAYIDSLMEHGVKRPPRRNLHKYVVDGCSSLRHEVTEEMMRFWDRIDLELDRLHPEEEAEVCAVLKRVKRYQEARVRGWFSYGWGLAAEHYGGRMGLRRRDLTRVREVLVRKLRRDLEDYHSEMPRQTYYKFGYSLRGDYRFFPVNDEERRICRGCGRPIRYNAEYSLCASCLYGEGV